MKSSIDLSQWRNPPVEYKPAPFWVWNETQEPKELLRQIREMKAHGFGGFFMHARVGLKTPYLGADWFEHVRICTAEAAKLGMQAWIYDEERWPSGFAGGHIADVEGLDYPVQALSCREVEGSACSPSSGRRGAGASRWATTASTAPRPWTCLTPR